MLVLMWCSSGLVVVLDDVSKCNFAGLRGIDGMVCSRILYVTSMFVLFIVHCFVCFVLGLFDFKVLFLGSRNSSWGSRLVS